METIKDDLKKLKVDVVNVVDKKLLVDEIEYVCKSNNITQLEIKKDFLFSLFIHCYRLLEVNFEIS